MKIEYFIFTCPKCGSHELMRVDRSLVHSKERSVRRIDGKYLPGETESELVEIEPRGLAGLRCAACKFPDASKQSFRWKSWADVAGNGCFGPDPAHGKEKVACTIVSLDGRNRYRTYVMLAPGEELTEEMRQKVMRRVLGVKRGVLICERDSLEEVPGAIVIKQA